MSLNNRERRQTRSLTNNNSISTTNTTLTPNGNKQPTDTPTTNSKRNSNTACKQPLASPAPTPPIHQHQTRNALKRSNASLTHLETLNESKSSSDQLTKQTKSKSKTGDNQNTNLCVNNNKNNVKNEPTTSSLSSSSSSCEHQTVQENLPASESVSKIGTRRRSSNFRSSTCLPADLSLSSSLSRKRNPSSSLDLSKNESNIENLNNDLYTQAQVSSSASSSSTGPSNFHNFNKRLKLKHKYAFKELSINENNSQTSFRLLSKDEFDNSSLNENKDDLDEESQENPELKENITCPVLGCNSEGHIDGLTEHHYSFDTCPIYFHTNKDECSRHKTDLDKKLTELKEKISRINENKKTLRNKQISKEQSEYFNKVNTDLKQLVKFGDANGTSNRKKINFLAENADLIGDIKNLTTSFIINSISNCLAPTPMPTYHPSLIKHSANASNFLNSLNSNKAQAPDLNDLEVSRFEFDLFKDSLTKEVIPGKNRLKLVNKSNKTIQFGNYEIETWYKSPYPDDIWQLNKIFICQYCLIYMKSHSVLNRHLQKCLWRHPPGREIYRKDLLSFFEVDGKFNKIYCQNLCLLAKLFLDHKTLYYDVEPFLFYVLTQYNEETGSFQMIGYFSKEKQSVMNYNLSCILILPQFMNKGFGRVLIDFSYLLSRVEGKIGSPERPLSDLGLISYRSYWKSKLIAYLDKCMDDSEVSVKEISAETGILTNDLISTLQYMGLIKYWKGKHVIIKDKELFDKYLERKSVYTSDVDPVCLKWTPYVYQTIINDSDNRTTSSKIVKSNKLNYSLT